MNSNIMSDSTYFIEDLNPEEYQMKTEHSKKKIFNDPKDLIEYSATKVCKLFQLYHARLKLVKEVISNKILENVICIQSNFRGFLISKRIRTNLIINYLLEVRLKSVIIIQRKFRNHYYVSMFNKILEKEKHNYSVYFLLNTPGNSLVFRIFITNNEIANYDFEFCKIRKIYVCYIPKKEVSPHIFLCSFIVNNIAVLDSRYPTIYCGKSFYNKIDFKELEKEDSDEDDNYDKKNNVPFSNNKFFNLKNIDFLRKKIEEDVKEELMTKGGKSTFTKIKKTGSNLSFTSLKKAEISRAKKVQFNKSLTELFKKQPTKSILKNKHFINYVNKKPINCNDKVKIIYNFKGDLDTTKDFNEDNIDDENDISYKKKSSLFFEDNEMSINKSPSDHVKIKKKVYITNGLEVFEYTL